jgi:hypothetical protein
MIWNHPVHNRTSPIFIQAIKLTVVLEDFHALLGGVALYRYA